jgi:hypothetical protein
VKWPSFTPARACIGVAVMHPQSCSQSAVRRAQFYRHQQSVAFTRPGEADLRQSTMAEQMDKVGGAAGGVHGKRRACCEYGALGTSQQCSSTLATSERLLLQTRSLCQRLMCARTAPRARARHVTP